MDYDLLLYKSFSQNILFNMSSRLSKIRSVHTYVMPRTVESVARCLENLKIKNDLKSCQRRHCGNLRWPLSRFYLFYHTVSRFRSQCPVTLSGLVSCLWDKIAICPDLSQLHYETFYVSKLSLTSSYEIFQSLHDKHCTVIQKHNKGVTKPSLISSYTF